MAGELTRKRLRMRKIDRLLMTCSTQQEVANELGVSLSTLQRYLKQRNAKLREILPDRQAATFSYLVRTSISDYEELGAMIEEMEQPSLVKTDAYGKRLQLARNLARFFGIESTIKVQNIQNNLHLNRTNNSVSVNGPVQIIVEGNGGQFDNEFGAVRVDSPTNDEINSATG